MSNILSDARHQAHSNLEALWSSGNPHVLPVRGSPWCEVVLDPVAREVRLRTDNQIPEPEVARLKNVTFTVTALGSREIAELCVKVEDNVHGAYGLLTTIADELQVERAPLAVAVATGIERHKDLLAPRGGLSLEQEIGLYGEILFLNFLVGVIGPAAAVASWFGPQSEEHDFVLPEFNVEVKTTTSERRMHVIHGLLQLVPVDRKSLFLVSVQLTRSTPEVGLTLPGLIVSVRRSVGGYASDLDRRLDVFGWHTEDADLYATAWQLRSRPRAYCIDEDFPALTPARLKPVVPRFGLLSDVSYRLDVTDMAHDSLPDPVSIFVDPQGGSRP